MRRSVAFALCASLLGGAPVAAQIVFEPPLLSSPLEHDHYPVSAVGDVDGDGDPDVVLGLDGFAERSGYAVLLDDGTGHIAQVSFVSADDGFVSVVLADVDEDGRLDLLSTGALGLALRAGAGDGSFAAATVLVPPQDPPVWFFEVGEVTGDTHLDLLLMSGTHVDLSAGAGDGSFGAIQPIADLAPQKPRAARVALLDGDAITDLVVVADTIVPPSVAIDVAWSLIGLGAGAFATGATHLLGDHSDVELADVTDDGVADLVAASAAGVRVRPGLGDGSFGAATVLESGAFESGLAVADLDGDGWLDAAAINGQTSELVVWRGAAGGGLAEDLRHTAADAWSWPGEVPEGLRPLAVADFDLDGRPDLLRTSSDNDLVRLSVFRNHSTLEGDPIVDVGGELADPALLPFDLQVDAPILLVDGTLVAGSPLHVRLYRHGVEATQAWFVLGFSALEAPFLGGTMVPQPDVLVGPFTLGFAPADKLDVTAPMPALPSGFSMWLQAWFLPSFAFVDPAASSAVRLTAP